jgi:hypothetical protein
MKLDANTSIQIEKEPAQTFVQSTLRSPHQAIKSLLPMQH